MADDSLVFLPAVELGRRIASGETTSVAAVRATLDRIARLEPTLHVFELVTADAALDAAAAADAEIAAGKLRGPLHGVPVAVKDLCDMAGLPTAAGMPLRRDTMADKDSTVVARLKAAGCVIVGKLQLTEGATAEHHPKIPVPINPWSPSLWTGVSSSGSGVATAAGLCYGSLGSDTGGSIRAPSAQNGLTGIKPTWGRISRAGVFPLADSLDHVGPIARSAEDVAAMLAILAGPDPADPTASHVKVPDYLASLRGGVKGLRIGVDKRYLAICDKATVEAIQGALEIFAKLGAEIVDVTLPDFQALIPGYLGLSATELAISHESIYPSRAAEYGSIKGFLDFSATVTARDLTKYNHKRAEFKGHMEAVFESTDLFIIPVHPKAAITAAEVRATAMDPSAFAARIIFTAPINLAGLPSLTLPGGSTEEGYPVAFQIIGRWWDEDAVLRAGHAFQEATEWHKRRPKL
ncbi:amidase [Hyaloraphidium curvatum]|nr:amidase [Hyaloraphidium curvatum]